MTVHEDGTLAAFFQRLRRSPVRWVVLTHFVLLTSMTGLLYAMRASSVFVWLGASLVIAQVALLLIWMTFAGPRKINAIPGLIGLVPAFFIALTIPALPLLFARSRGMQLDRFTPDTMPAPQRLQFSIRSVMVGVIGVAALFSLKGLVAGLGNWPEPRGIGLVAALATIVMGMAVATMVLTIPLASVWVVLTPGKVLPRLVTGLVGWGMGAMLLFHYTRTEPFAHQLAVYAGVTAGAIPILLATLLVLRWMGFRTVWLNRDELMAMDYSEPGSASLRKTDHGDTA